MRLTMLDYFSSCVLLILTLVGQNSEAMVSSNVSCGAVRTKYHGTGLLDQIPMQSVSGQSLEICAPAEVTCCTPSVESSLSVQARKQFDDAIAARLEPLTELLDKKRERLDEMFFTLLNYSKSEFEKMFKDTYGQLYLQNSEVFEELYTSLESYYRTGKPEITQQLDDFFRNFYKKMFLVYNSQYTFSDQYQSCVLTYMEALRPFGDVPAKFGSSIKRSFVALRTFVRGLNISSSVVKSLLKVNPSKSCVRELMRLTHCSTCQGLPDVRPCLPYCLHIHTHCLQHLHHFATDWKNFVDAMVTVGDRLLNPFNIETVVRPINLQISDAVMNFQLAGLNISETIFTGCGPPSLGRKKRDVILPETTTAANPQIQMSRQLMSDETEPGNPNNRQRMNGSRREGRRRVYNGEGKRPGRRRMNGGRRRRPGSGRRGEAGGIVSPTNGRELSLEKLDFATTGRDQMPPSINRIIKEIKTKLENSRQFLEEVSPQLCGEVASKQDSSCWSGTQLGRSADVDLPLLPASPPQAGVHEQTFKLQGITRHLQAAANGQDIAWMEEQRINDGVDSHSEGSGSETGSGDWDNIDKEEHHEPKTTWEKPRAPKRGQTNSYGQGGQDQFKNNDKSYNFPPDDEDGYDMRGSGYGPNYSSGTGRGTSPPTYRGSPGRGQNNWGSRGPPSTSRGGGGRPRYDDDSYEGSGDQYYTSVNRNPKYNRPKYPHNSSPPYNPNSQHPPSGVAKEDMSLSKAITVYLIPAILMYFGSIG